MTNINTNAAIVAHLKKSLRALHMALAVSEKYEAGEKVTDSLRLAIHQVHVALAEMRE